MHVAVDLDVYITVLLSIRCVIVAKPYITVLLSIRCVIVAKPYKDHQNHLSESLSNMYGPAGNKTMSSVMNVD